MEMKVIKNIYSISVKNTILIILEKYTYKNYNFIQFIKKAVLKGR